MAKKLTIKGLERMIREEVHQYEKELEKRANATKEVDADEYAGTLEKDEDHTSDEPKAPSMKTTAESIRRANKKLVGKERRYRKALMEIRRKKMILKKKFKSLKKRR